MSDTWVSVLTPPGAGAIATVEVCGPRAHELARALFKPAGKPLPEVLEVSRFWFGTLGADEVVLAVTGPKAIEVHCHGGRRVVRWVVELFLASGGREPSECSPTLSASAKHPSPTERSTSDERSASLKEPTERSTPGELNSSLGTLGERRGELSSPLGGLTPPARLLQLAPTLRTANIILDQLNGAFALKVQQILRLIDTDPASAKEPLGRLTELGNTIGRHLVEPWKVVVTGPPNVGKSSLVNALAGYQRAVVSEVAGTTRDAVSVRTAFDGWPVELIDTAGLREAEGLEAEGIGRAKQEVTRADLVIWMLDATASEPVWPDPHALPIHRLLYAANKCDRTFGWDPALATGGATLHVSATTGQGVTELAAAISRRLVGIESAPGTAVPISPHQATYVNLANAELAAGRTLTASAALRTALEPHTAGASPFPSNP